MKIKYYTKKEDAVIGRFYKFKGNVSIGEMISRSGDSVKHRMLVLGLKRTKRQVLKLRKNTNSGQFKKGNVPHNINYDGHERITKDGYIEIRVKQGKYRLKHLFNWECVNGKLPVSCCLRCIDGNKLNTAPSNWKLITRADNMAKNSWANYPVDLKRSIQLINKINREL